MTRAERLMSKLKEIKTVAVRPLTDEMNVALVFLDENGEDIGNVALHISGAFNIARGLVNAAVASTSIRACKELQRRASAEEARAAKLRAKARRAKR